MTEYHVLMISAAKTRAAATQKKIIYVTTDCSAPVILVMHLAADVFSAARILMVMVFAINE
jgi:hypothetical protein